MDKKVMVVYTGPMEGFFIDEADVHIVRGVPVEVPEWLFKERDKCDPRNWSLYNNAKKTKGGD